MENTRRRSDTAVSGAVDPRSSAVVDRAADAASESVVATVTAPGAVQSPDDTILVAADQYTGMDTLDNVILGNDGI